MGPRPARITVGPGSGRDGAPAAGPCGRAGMFVLAAAAGLALASGAVTGTPAAHAAAAARQATTISASAAIICPPPSGDGVMSKSGDPGC